MTDPSVNVTTVDDLSQDRLLGPMPVISNIMDTMVMIGLRCSEIRPVTQQIKIDPKEMENLTSSRHFHWLFYIQSARDDVEQNLEVITKHGQLYYRVTRNVSSGEELFVWYSKESTQIYKVPDVDEFYDKEDRKYSCPYCSEAFVFSNPFKAHLMYRCEMRLAEVHGLSSVNRLQLDSINRLQLDLYSSAAAMLPSVKSSVTLKGLDIASLATSFLDIYRRTTAATLTKDQHCTSDDDVTDDVEADDEDNVRCQSQGHEPNVSGCHVNCRDSKRKIDSEVISEHVGPKRLKNSNNNNNNNNSEKLIYINAKSLKPSTLRSSSMSNASRNSPVHRHQQYLKKRNSPSYDLETSGSAFKKVSKSCRDRLSPSNSKTVVIDPHQHCIAYNPCDKPLYPMSYSLPLTTASPPAAVMAITAGALATSSGWSLPMATGTSSIVDPSRPPHQQQQEQQQYFRASSTGMMTSSKLIDIRSSSSTCSPGSDSKFLDNAATGLKRSSSTISPSTADVDSSASATAMMYTDSIYRLSVSLPSYSSSKQFSTSLVDNFVTSSKPPPQPPLPPPPQPASSLQPPQAPPAMSPIAASLLPPSLAALAFPAQNWCAKCNASFRMTSDLVYHMRSHHKREVDPMKKKREEKLKCSICSESFRERHHLTRHMTSHQ